MANKEKTEKTAYQDIEANKTFKVRFSLEALKMLGVKESTSIKDAKELIYVFASKGLGKTLPRLTKTSNSFLGLDESTLKKKYKVSFEDLKNDEDLKREISKKIRADMKDLFLKSL